MQGEACEVCGRRIVCPPDYATLLQPGECWRGANYWPNRNCYRLGYEREKAAREGAEKIAKMNGDLSAQWADKHAAAEHRIETLEKALRKIAGNDGSMSIHEMVFAAEDALAPAIDAALAGAPHAG